MILLLSTRYRKTTACLLASLFYTSFVLAGYRQLQLPAYDPATVSSSSYVTIDPAPAFTATAGAPTIAADAQAAEEVGEEDWGSGPAQPEMQAFQPVNGNNMVDLFSGDFSYNIPLMDVGGYPINIGYKSGVSMDQEASWVGLGWNINPGTITRNMRGIPDDFDGKTDSIRKTSWIKENRTIGVTAGSDIEIKGFPLLKLSYNAGVFHNTYRGWGAELGLNASIRAGVGSKGTLTGGLSITDNSQQGLTVQPSLSYALAASEEGKAPTQLELGSSFSYNSRYGIKGLQLSTGVRQYGSDRRNQLYNEFSSTISFATAAYTPTITMPYTSAQFTFTAKGGGENKVIHPSSFISGYVSRNYISTDDTTIVLPSYGYLNYQGSGTDRTALLDVNREKEIPYRDKPLVPHIAIPSYTYDVFSITGEGTGGMFRAYRGDIGFTYDHYIRTKDNSSRFSIDFGEGDLAHFGADLNLSRAYTQNGPWLSQNTLQQVTGFRKPDQLFEAAYFKNPAEKAINDKKFYQAVGDDDVVTVNLQQSGGNSPVITATNYLNRYRNKKLIDKLLLTPANAVKSKRDKRTQVITYLTAGEAGLAGLSKYIENYPVNRFSIARCTTEPAKNPEGQGTGLSGYYYSNNKFKGTPFRKQVAQIDFQKNQLQSVSNRPVPNFPGNNFSVRWLGRLKAPVSGSYKFFTRSDDGIRVTINDKVVIQDLIEGRGHAEESRSSDWVNLAAGQFYQLMVEYRQDSKNTSAQLLWQYPGKTKMEYVPTKYLYLPDTTEAFVSDTIVKEKRVNTFRRANHLSEVDVLNADGRRYVYGIPVYNFKQAEVTFSINSRSGNRKEGLVAYRSGIDDRPGNGNGKDQYFNKEVTPAYAHSFLLTGILSADYSDITGDGITDDDLGDAIKFNYSKVYDAQSPYLWRAPYVTDSATYNEGMRTDNSDDKASYVYGEKELWYLHSVESKNMIATFWVEDRKDALSMDIAGRKQARSGKLLRKIDLYTKADFTRKGINALPIKTVHFEYSYELCRGINRPLNDSGKLTLKKIWFTYNGNDKGKRNPYVFTYHATNPGYSIKNYDRWGNYKDPLQNPAVTGAEPLSNAEYPYSLQDSAVAAGNAGAWGLYQIGLPSGGNIRVDYESDDYAYVQNRRAMNLFKVTGFSATPAGPVSNSLYSTLYGTLNGSQDNLYVQVQIPRPVSSKQELQQTYLEGVSKLYFRLNVKMPSDKYGGGYEYLPCYADLADYDLVNATTIRLRLKGITGDGQANGTMSPLAKAAIQFLRLNLPSKAYPGSDIGGDGELKDVVLVVLSLAASVLYAFTSFDAIARQKQWASQVNLDRTWVRLNNPFYKKYGGGHRVKRIVISDNWNAMTGQRTATYGQEYTYTTQKTINGQSVTLSSGVAAYEPSVGGEENPFHQPVEYTEKLAPLAPVTLGYTEEPLGESFFPAANVGYSQVRVRTIHARNIKSANGYEETRFYTAYDFPTITDYTLLADNKKRYKPALSNFLRIDARYYLGLSQGFKVELNDMHGKMRSQATYPETDAGNPLSYTENFYKVDNPNAVYKHLANTVPAVNPAGEVDTATIIGKDIELMMDMREQLSITNGNNINIDADIFSVPFLPPVFLLPSLINLAQREENLYHSVATTKLVQRYGILDSVVHIEKGSKVVTENMLYDSETGNVLLSRTRNEFNDPVYSFTYPSHWAYDGAGQAYKNIAAIFDHLFLKNGRIVRGLTAPAENYFASGDELLVASKQSVEKSTTSCTDKYATFPDHTRLWAVDANLLKGGSPSFFFIDQEGHPFTGNDVSMKIIRSGRRNIEGAVGSVTSLQNPLVWDAGGQRYKLDFNTGTQVVAAAAAEYRQLWQVTEQRKQGSISNCVSLPYQDCTAAGSSACTFQCLKRFFDYLISSQNLFISRYDAITVDSLVTAANQANFNVQADACPVLAQNLQKPFYALTFDTVATRYKAQIGDCTVTLDATNPAAVSFYRLQSKPQPETGRVAYFDASPYDTLQTRAYVIRSMEQAGNSVDSGVVKLRASMIPGHSNIASYFLFDSVPVPGGPQHLLNASLHLFTAPDGFQSPYYPYASSVTDATDPASIQLSVPGFAWNYSTPVSDMRTFLDMPGSNLNINSPFFDYVQDVTAVLRNQYFSWPNGNTGFCLMAPGFNCIVDPDMQAQYLAFCSQRYPDTTLQPFLDVTYQVPRSAEQQTATIASLGIASCEHCEEVSASICYNPVTDTTVNPYVYGLLGNYRSNKSYTYFGARAGAAALQATNIRKDGTFESFAPFWQFAQSRLQPRYDTTRWVWNTEITRYSNKGYELENKDALGRYNTGLYGYNAQLPTAVVQNAQYKETAVEGFEDYDYDIGGCGTVCPSNRHFDFSPLKNRITGQDSHTGRYSLLVQPNDAVAVSAVVAATEADPDVQLATAYDSCTGSQGLQAIQAGPATVLPVFSPLSGKKILVSGWAKEQADCQCTQYRQVQLAVSYQVNGETRNLVLQATGKIIEGWQRFEGVVDLPAAAANFTLNLMATGSTAVYFDDLRIHPFNASMKSFVYDPQNLRLMAELDENNYASFYEYDDDGTLVRVKKETARGIKTIKETRSALLKQ